MTGVQTCALPISKNAILIVEFAKELHEQGKGIVEAAIEASRMRLRPIIMTSMAFILGVLPLAISSGAGSGSQHAIGTGVIGGMITATVLAIFWVPLFFATVSAAGDGEGQQGLPHAAASLVSSSLLRLSLNSEQTST